MEPSHLPYSSLTHPAAILTPSIGVLRWIRAKYLPVPQRPLQRWLHPHIPKLIKSPQDWEIAPWNSSAVSTPCLENIFSIRTLWTSGSRSSHASLTTTTLWLTSLAHLLVERTHPLVATPIRTRVSLPISCRSTSSEVVEKDPALVFDMTRSPATGATPGWISASVDGSSNRPPRPAMLSVQHPEDPGQQNQLYHSDNPLSNSGTGWIQCKCFSRHVNPPIDFNIPTTPSRSP